jgi:GAF domain-containing protein/anti-sigma regulatory factor (Ser/Thr protein kinase)
MLQKRISLALSEAARSASLLVPKWEIGLWLPPVVTFVVLLIGTVILWRADTAGGAGSARRVLWIGLVLSLCLAGAVFQLLLQRTRAHEQTQRHLAALESLNRISTAISGQLGAGTRVLDQLAEAARSLLNMSQAVIAVLDEQKKTLDVQATAGRPKPSRPRLFTLDQLPLCTRSLQTGEMIFQGDISALEVPLNQDAARMFDVTAIVLIPLKVEGRRIGLLVLTDSQPKRFADSDRRLGELLGAQASVILSNNQLYERMRSALDARSRLLRQRQALSAANAAIQSTDTIGNSLQQITRLVPAVLGAHVCGLTLLTPAGGSILTAATPPFDYLAGTTIGANSLSDEAFRTRNPVMIRDARHEPRLHESWKEIPDVGSILYVPMFRSDREPLGILALARYTTGSFSRDQVELAQTFAALTAVAVENARLLEQTRRDAEAKTVLLRELNHRVKNNLAGIVALLTISPPEMPADVRAWLDRATDRIRAMAGAHQLFTGGTERVGLDALIAQTLSSLSVARPANVLVNTDLNGGGIALGTERAVGLAMVLHELCYNAMVHGLRQGGTLTIRARRDDAEHPQEEGGVVIEVMDHGAANGAADAGNSAAPTDTATGQGLSLVQGLVRRELRGKFTIGPRPEGGTVARVEFPLNGE